MAKLCRNISKKKIFKGQSHGLTCQNSSLVLSVNTFPTGSAWCGGQILEDVALYSSSKLISRCCYLSHICIQLDILHTRHPAESRHSNTSRHMHKLLWGPVPTKINWLSFCNLSQSSEMQSQESCHQMHFSKKVALRSKTLQRKATKLVEQIHFVGMWLKREQRLFLS